MSAAKIPSRLTATEAAAAIARRELTSVDLVQSCLDRIAEREQLVHAWAYCDPETALRQARAADRGELKGPLAGVPVGIKDMIDTADQPTQHNSPLYVGHRPALDASVVTILRAAGAVILGKTDTHEFAAGGALPRARNPHNPAHTAGGSSSGSAAAVADYMVPLAFGTQTAGSTLRPASFCGVCAMKPTYGTVGWQGAKHYSPSLDTIGWFARSVADLALVGEVLSIGRSAAAAKPLASLRLGFCRTPMWDQASADCRSVVESAVAALRGSGVRVEEIDLPASFARLPGLQRILMRAEGKAAFMAEYRRFGDRLHREFRDQVDNADGYTREQIREAYDTVAAFRPVIDDLIGAFDAIVTPSAVGEAPHGHMTTGDPLFNRVWTALHVPCVTLPFGRGSAGLPIGIQLVAPRWHDCELLVAAAAVEAALASHRSA